MLKPEEVAKLEGLMSAEERHELHRLLEGWEKPVWEPLAGPQRMAYQSEADVVGFGGAAGGGKTDLVIGKALTRHRRTLILRPVGTELAAIRDRVGDILGTKDGYNGRDNVWRWKGRHIEFGAVPDVGDAQKYQGRPHDYLCVGRGTMVRMANGQYWPIESLRPDDVVDTLQGPRKINRVWPVRRDKAVLMTVRDKDGNWVGQQVQSVTHEILSTSMTWDSFASISSRGKSAEATSSHGADKCEMPTYAQSPILRQVLLSSYSNRHAEQYSIPFEQWCHRVMQGFYVCVDATGRGIYCGSSQCKSRGCEQPPSNSSLPSQQLPSLGLSELNADSPSIVHGAFDGKSSSSLQDSQGDCPKDSRSCDVRIRALIRCPHVLEDALKGPQLPGDAELPNPSGSPCANKEKTPKCTSRTCMWPHPYTKDAHLGLAGTCSYSCEFQEIGEADLFDIEVDEVNHYITKSGIVNKNCFDEAANFREADIRFLSTWVRTTVKGQKCQTMLTFNPPTTAEGRWVIAFFAPWLDKKHPNPARSGELRWFVVMQDEQGNSRDVEVSDNRLRVQEGDHLVTDFDEKTVDKLKILRPQSRTFIPSKVSDNKYLLETGYVTQLQSLPEPLRSQMLHGDFLAGVRDDEWQVIPTLWVEMAQARWTEDGREDYLSAMGVDVARGGRDKTVVAKRYGAWVDRLIKRPGKDTPDGMYVVKLIQEALAMETEMNRAITHIDATGVGTSPADMGRWEGLAINPVIFGASTYARDRSGIMRMRNVRAWLWWNMRDMLDPDKGDDLALPPDPEILADLTSARWKPTVSGVQVEDKQEIIKRIGRSPDCGEAVVLCFYPSASQNIVTKRALNMNRRTGLGRGGERAISNAYRIGRD